MSGVSDSVECINCGKEAMRYTDYKPYDYTIFECPYCGAYSSVGIGQFTLLELNEIREQMELDPLDKLPEMTIDDAGYKIEGE